MQFVLSGSKAIITCGRAFDESETEVALVPENIRDFDIADNSIRDVPGKSLLDKTLVFIDECNNSHKAKVVGVYSSTDPLYSGKQILIPQKDLNKYTDEVLENSSTAGISLSKNKSFIILVDSSDNVEKIITDGFEL